MVAGKNTRSEFDRLLQIRNEQTERIAEVDRQIQDRFGRTCAILVLDLSGFSQLTIQFGILHFLGVIRRMSAIAEPVVVQHSGQVIKQEADNLYAVFPDVTEAIAASLNIFKRFAAANTKLPEEQDLHASIGIGYGDLLMVADNDVFGSEMNLACKLGEDLARRSEILLTEAAFNRVKHLPGGGESLSLSISGMEVVAYRVRSRL